MDGLVKCIHLGRYLRYLSMESIFYPNIQPVSEQIGEHLIEG